MNTALLICRIIMGTAALLDIIRIVRKLIPLYKELRESKCVKNQPGVISAEAEVIGITENRLSQWDIQYTLNLRYEIGGLTYFKEINLLNKQSARVGQKVTLLCDDLDPSYATVQNGAELSAVRNLIFHLCVDMILIIVDLLI